jgi:hypothetical protein
MKNSLSFSSIKLDRISKEGKHLKPASGFVVEAGGQYHLITNWHVVSGRDILTRELLEPDLEPNTLRTSLHIRRGQGEYTLPLTSTPWKRLTIELYGEDHIPRWTELPNSERQPMIDVVALRLLPSQLLLTSRKENPMDKLLDPTGLYKKSWEEISSIPISAIDMEVEYGPSDAVDVIGHPLGWAPYGTHKPASAFWRRSSVACEIKEAGVGITTQYPFFIDPCPLEGMTGSPVVGMKNDCLKLLGVYSDSSTAGFGANAGLVWNASVLKKLIGTS